MTDSLTRRGARRTKIIATLGPASDSPEMMRALFRSGVDVFRLNFSHGTHAEHAKRIAQLRALESESVSIPGALPVTICADLQGPKLRIGQMTGGAVTLVRGQPFSLDLHPALGNDQRACLPHPEIFQALESGAILLLDDGKLRLRVQSCAADHARTIVEVGGVLSDHKGVNVPALSLPLAALTEKDKTDLAFVLDQGVDLIALSFVQRPEDVIEARELIGDRARIVVKLEKPGALTHLESIIDQADAVMVARGDLGVEMPFEDVPHLQRRIIQACRAAGKPVIVATHILESMIHNPRPTRAEVSDLASCVAAGADAVMLSAESAAGQYPIEAVQVMDTVLRRAEKESICEMIQTNGSVSTCMAAGAGALTTARRLNVPMILEAPTAQTALGAAQARSAVPVIVRTPCRATARFLNVCWGVLPLLRPDALTPECITALCGSASAVIVSQEASDSPHMRMMHLQGTAFSG